MRSWLGKFPLNRSDFLPQPNGDLGSRLISAMDHGFASGADRVFFLGGDCPGLTHSYLEEAEAALVETDMIIASARDGGYVLLGLQETDGLDFRGNPMEFGNRLRGDSSHGHRCRSFIPLSAAHWRTLMIWRATNVKFSVVRFDDASFVASSDRAR